MEFNLEDGREEPEKPNKNSFSLCQFIMNFEMGDHLRVALFFRALFPNKHTHTFCFILSFFDRKIGAKIEKILEDSTCCLL